MVRRLMRGVSAPTRTKRPRKKKSCRILDNDWTKNMAKVLIPTPLRQYVGGKDTVELAGASIGEVLGNLTSQFPELRRNLYNEEGKLRSFVNVYLNDDDIRYLGKDSTAVKDGDTVTIVPSIARGA